MHGLCGSARIGIAFTVAALALTGLLIVGCATGTVSAHSESTVERNSPLPDYLPSPNRWARVDDVRASAGAVTVELTPLESSGVEPGDVIIVIAYSEGWTQEHPGQRYAVATTGATRIDYDLETDDPGWYGLQLRENNTGRVQYISVNLPGGEWQE